MTFEEFKKRAANGTLIKPEPKPNYQSAIPETSNIISNSSTQPKSGFGKVLGKTVATPVAALGQLGTGVMQGLEGAVDFGTSIGVTGINSMRNQSIEGMQKDLQKLQKQGNFEAAARLQKVINQTKSDRDYSNKVAEDFIGKQWVQDYVGNSVDQFTEQYSYLPVKAGQIVKTVGNMLPSIANAGSIAKSLPQATTKLGQLATKGATMLPFMAQAAGSSTEQALNEGANLADATKYGLASGVLEGAIESISGGIGGSVGGKVLSSKLGKEAIERIAKNSLGKFALRLADAGIDVAGEGFEEVLSTAINPLIQRMTYDEQAELATSEEMMQSFIDGALASLLVKGGQAGLSRLTTQNNANVQENEAQNQAQTQNIEQGNATLPTQTEMAQNANMNQITDNNKNKLLNKIKNNQYMSQEEKNDLIATVNNTNITSEVETEINNILNTINEEFGLKNITSDFNSNKTKYAQYVNDKSDMDNSYIDNSKNAIDTKDGRRTKDQWLSIAKNLGSQIYEMPDTEIEKYAYRTWIENKPNNVQNLNRQGKKYIKFGLDEWVNTVYDSVRETRNRVAEKPINTLPTQKAQETLQSAKLAGMTDMDIQKAKELNDMLRSGTRLKFYDPQNIPQGVDVSRAADANGFYMDGTLWINKNSEMKVERILGHELTHHVENDDLINTILDSNIFYDFLSEKGFSNTAEFKKYLMEKKGYKQEELTSEMVAHFAEEKLFGKEETINRLARENRTLAQKILNWLSDLKTKIAGSSEAKELLRIENMYRKALDQARSKSTSNTTDTTKMFEPNQIKNVDNTNPTENADIRFSLNEPVEETKDLVALHNLTEDKLKGILDLDGFPVPSIAISKVDIPHTAFGNITIVFGKDTINPANKYNEVYDRDVYSPRFPQVDVEVNEKLLNDIDDLFPYDSKDDYLMRVRNDYLDMDNARNKIDNRGVDGYLNEIKNDDKFKYAYLKMNNPDFTYEYKNKYTDTETAEYDSFLKEYYKTNSKPLNELTYDEAKALIPIINEAKKGTLTKEMTDEGLTGELVDKYVKELSLKDDDYAKADQYIYKVSQYEKALKRGDAKTIDKDKTNEKINKEINQAEYEAWVDEQFENIALSKGIRNNKDIFTPSGNRRSWKQLHDNYSLENIVRYMTSQATTGSESGFMGKGFGNIASQQAKKYKSVDEIRSDKGKLRQFEDEHTELQKYQDELYDDVSELGKYHNALSSGDWQITEVVSDTLFSFAKGKTQNISNLIKELKADNFDTDKIPTELLEKTVKDIVALKDIPTQYFEAKPQRAVGFDEVLAAVVPKDTDASIKSRLQEKGVNVIEYDGEVEGDRLRAVNSVENAKFSLNAKGDNTNPTENPDIRYRMNPVEVAKNPPNIETGLDQLKRTSRVKEGDTQSNFTRNIYNQSIFDDKFKDLALDDKNIRSYASISNKETLQEANDAINEQGQKWVDRFLDKPNGEMKATDIAGGFILMNRYQQAGDYESMIRVAEKLRKAGTQQGQTIQMFSVLGRMTPEGMTYYAQKELSKAYDEILKNKTQKWADEHADEFKLNEKDIEYIQRRVNQAARLPEGRDKYVLLGEIASRIQNKIPPQAGQGLKALARNSMLLNPKTMVRNILGNVVIVPNHIVSDFVGAGIDKAISKKTGVRTTGGFDVKALQGAKKGIYESFDDFRRKISTREMGGDRFEIGQGKNFYENHTGRFGETRNKINKALNGLDRVTGFLLETGDRPFYETWFINSLNNQMKLNNVTEPTAEMIEIATDEALQRTWQDNNSYTRVVKSVRDGLNKLNVKGYGLGDMVMPFVKTPANLTKAVIDFSPLGAINAALKTSQFNKDIGKGTATTKQQREVVKAWSQVITGTLGMAMLTALANAGVLTGGSDEDKDVRAFEQNILGIKPYSIKIGDKTYTYDWAQPLGTSAAMVADTVKSLKNAKDTEGKVAAILEGAQSGASVLLEQSFVSGIRNLFEEDNLINALIETGFNEASKFTPQFLSQLAQIQDDTARTSYVYNNIPQTALNKVKAKIPGLRQTLEPSVDVLGREVKTDNSVGNVMFNPANTAFARTTEGAEEMYRIYQATGDKATIAQVAPYYFNVGSEKIVLTPKQRTQYQKTIGKIASDGVENLLKNKAYKSLEDTDKAEILKDLYSYGTAIAKAEASTSYLLPSEMQKIKDSGMSPEEYILLKYISNLGGTKKDEKYNSLISAGYSQKETEEFLTDYKGYKFESTSKNTLPTLKQQRAKLPTLKK